MFGCSDVRHDPADPSAVFGFVTGFTERDEKAIFNEVVAICSEYGTADEIGFEDKPTNWAERFYRHTRRRPSEYDPVANEEALQRGLTDPAAVEQFYIGWAAFHRIPANPHPEGSAAAKAWEQGHRAASENSFPRGKK
jgi:hypothetical protein